jgi:two-component system sensor histidine kinase FlrB
MATPAVTASNRPTVARHRTAQLVRNALTHTRHVTAREGLDVWFTAEAGAQELWCDAAQINEVLVNLIVNAAQAMPEGGRITVNAAPDRDALIGQPAARLSVSDTGAGIEPDHRSRLFDPFFTTKEQGTGLGLAIVHAIVEGHRGRVEVYSEVGRGSTFTIVLPQPAVQPSAIGHQLRP